MLDKFREFCGNQSRNWKVIMARNSLGTLFTGVCGAGGGPMVMEGAAGGGQYWTVFMDRLGVGGKI